MRLTERVTAGNATKAAQDGDWESAKCWAKHSQLTAPTGKHCQAAKTSSAVPMLAGRPLPSTRHRNCYEDSNSDR